MTRSHTVSASRIEEIAQAWARDNSLRKLRSRKKRNFKHENADRYEITKAAAWKALKRAIAIKRDLLSDSQEGGL